MGVGTRKTKQDKEEMEETCSGQIEIGCSQLFSRIIGYSHLFRQVSNPQINSLAELIKNVDNDHVSSSLLFFHIGMV